MDAFFQQQPIQTKTVGRSFRGIIIRMIRVFSAVSAYQGLLRASKFRVGDGSDNDFKKVTKKPAAAAEEIT